MKASGIGGQAVMEGVMMKNRDKYAVAVRKEDQSIVVDVQEYVGAGDRHKIFKLPIIRGVVAFIESLSIGVKTLTWSASFFEDDEDKKTEAEIAEEAIKAAKSDEAADVEQTNADAETPAEAETAPEKPKNKQKGKTKAQKQAEEAAAKAAAEEAAIEEEIKAAARRKKEKQDNLAMAGTVCLSVVLAVGIFMMLPYFASRLLAERIESEALLALCEGVIRVLLFVGYVAAISLMKEIKRVYMYHGAEHKSINCIEHGLPLTVENVRLQSRQHKRCGTSFMLVVMMISVLIFMFIRVDSAWLRIVVRLLMIPVIAGISYEFIRLAGRSDNGFITFLSKPGLALQKLTTAEPDDSMIEVAIASVEAVFDWRDFLAHYEEPVYFSSMDDERTRAKEVIKAKNEERKAKEREKARREAEKKREAELEAKVRAKAETTVRKRKAKAQEAAKKAAKVKEREKARRDEEAKRQAVIDEREARKKEEFEAREREKAEAEAKHKSEAEAAAAEREARKQAELEEKDARKRAKTEEKDARKRAEAEERDARKRAEAEEKEARIKAEAEEKEAQKKAAEEAREQAKRDAEARRKAEAEAAEAERKMVAERIAEAARLAEEEQFQQDAEHIAEAEKSSKRSSKNKNSEDEGELGYFKANRQQGSEETASTQSVDDITRRSEKNRTTKKVEPFEPPKRRLSQEEEDDAILNALDQYFVFRKKETPIEAEDSAPVTEETSAEEPVAVGESGSEE